MAATRKAPVRKAPARRTTAAATTAQQQVELDIIKLGRGDAVMWLIGETPFYCNRMGAKAQRELLFPSGPLSKTQRATKLKHAPYAEFRGSPYKRRTPGPTKIMMLGSAPKMAMAGAALRMPTSVSKTEIKQLIQVPVDFVPLWGIPTLDMSVVRMAGISRTPDIRTRARLDRWAMRVPVRWPEPMLNEKMVGELAISAGFICGLGDWRIEKGGPNGGFRIVDQDDPELRDIIESGGYVAQEEALKSPDCANDETQELLEWYLEELARRGINPEDETPEDIEVDPGEEELMHFKVGANGSLIAPAADVEALDVQHSLESGD
jgi:hypothetical protein